MKHYPRYLPSSISKDLRRKLILLSGPRQSGKTTESMTFSPDFEYLNYDSDEDRLAIIRKEWKTDVSLLIFDELHKMKNWKAWLKGVWDKRPAHLPILVTGSARLDMARKMWDSLAGRHFQYRLYPFDLLEFEKLGLRSFCLELFEVGNLPEPFFERDKGFYFKWRKSHLDLILRQDALTLEAVREIHAIETLVLLLRERVGSEVSYASLARDLQRDPTTVKRWLELLENLYVIFKVTPAHRNLARSLLKSPKYYFFDSALVTGGEGLKLENLVAFSLLKWCHFTEDAFGRACSLNYVKQKDGPEVDFLLTVEGQSSTLIEVKWSEARLSPQLFRFQTYFPKARLLQISHWPFCFCMGMVALLAWIYFFPAPAVVSTVVTALLFLAGQRLSETYSRP